MNSWGVYLQLGREKEAEQASSGSAPARAARLPTALVELAKIHQRKGALTQLRA